MKYDYLIIGAGFFGSVLAERLTSKKKKVLVIDKRNHIGGNCYTYTDETSGINVHKYGTHIFHTNSDLVWDYINNFTQFNNYRHKVLSKSKGKIYSMPVNLHTINKVYKKDFNPIEAVEFLKKRIKKKKSKNLEDQALNFVGKEIYEKLIKGYTYKQWKTDPKFLPASIINRLPIRYNFNDFYFDDKYQGIPLGGYTPIFEKLLKNSDVELNCDFFNKIDDYKRISKKIIYSGPIDKYFDYTFGTLGWRSLKFQIKKSKKLDFQGTSVINYPDKNIAFTRIHEFKHLHPEKSFDKNTLIMKEFSIRDDNDPYYPMRRKEDMEKFEKYQSLIKKEKNVIFGGRLAAYRYFDMHQVIASALSVFNKLA